jgi:hypothetical protein
LLINGLKLKDYLDEEEAPVTLRCPACKDIYVRFGLWRLLRANTLIVKCVCSTVFEVPQYLTEPCDDCTGMAYVDLRPLPWQRSN